MSRTHKDKKWELRFPEDVFSFSYNTEQYPWLKFSGIKTKKKRSHQNYWYLRGSPSWWTNLFMNRPQRRKCKVWERKVLFQDIEEADCPFFKNKPHIYYW